MRLFRVYGTTIPGAEPEQVYFVIANDGDDAVALASHHSTAKGLSLIADADSKQLSESSFTGRGVIGHVPPVVFKQW